MHSPISHTTGQAHMSCALDWLFDWLTDWLLAVALPSALGEPRTSIEHIMFVLFLGVSKYVFTRTSLYVYTYKVPILKVLLRLGLDDAACKY